MTPITIEDVINKVRDYNPDADIKTIREAYDFANKAHAGARRLSGEEYIQHSLTTALSLADLRLDVPTIAAGLLHDVPEDTGHTLEELKERFGKEIATLVEGITKLGTLKYRGFERYAENLRKMFVAIAEDIRVVLIKFADRIHNLETLEFNRPDKRKRVALETLEIYAPIAGRLGMNEIKGQMEDLAFPYVFPREYSWIKKTAEEKLRVEKKYIEKIQRTIEKILVEEKIEFVKVEGRTKHLYSLYKKMLQKERDINRIYDFVALRIIVKNIPDCYRVLGVIHKRWTPLKGRIKDYIAQPKPNGYQSLHTTVFAERGKIVEFQIRDLEMHQIAEYGVATHWRYKESDRKKMTKEKTEWIKNFAELQEQVKDYKKYLSEVKFDIFQNRIFVFTPKGDVIDLPEHSTPVDFAYHIHTDIGNKCVGALVNEEITSLDAPLKSGDVVEILINKSRQKPNVDWLNFVKTQLAREKIKNTLKESEQGRLKNLLNFRRDKPR